MTNLYNLKNLFIRHIFLLFPYEELFHLLYTHHVGGNGLDAGRVGLDTRGRYSVGDTPVTLV